MELRRSTRIGAFVVAVMAFAGSMTGIAWAPKNLLGAGITASCSLTDSGAGTFQGSISVTGFTVVRDGLAAVGTMTGTCTPDVGGTAKPVEIPQGTAVVVPVTIDLLTCDVLDVQLGNTSIPQLGMTVFLSGRHLVVAPGAKAERARFCAAARLLAERPAASMTTALNHLIFQ
ncbi:MAG TPA: hypothetical protein VG318_11150 [Actinomycetota bacterium]|nr:hypothetical protein [Actinomycetota bacterium]